ncbi:hypothetical protein Rhopal_000273-T1 [Rhodotorula paludigena]|uniref:Uncharacterized protein n=1 Tax=Rhodotorula paludigena TaxID=86838 RepID=A0AAV5GC37_9BASI|nr:hypothetical protein Rhopal_000273-T1 [Rhodotorula paludigena]
MAEAPRGAHQDGENDRLSSASSDFLLLTTQTSPLLSPHAPIPLPRPRFLGVLLGAAVLDFAVTLYLALCVPVSDLPASAVAINLARPFVVAAAVSTKRAREMGPVMLGQATVSALVLLFRLNELVQTNAIPSPSPHSLFQLPFRLPHLPANVLNHVTLWYLVSFAFSLLHYALFAIFVGVRRRRNPFVERGPGGMRRSSTWGEQRWDGRTELVPGTGSVRSSRASGDDDDGLLVADAFEGGYSSAAEGSGDEDGTGLDSSLESEDEDDIIDIPRKQGGAGGSLRRRASRLSLRSPLLAPAPEDAQRSGGPGQRPPGLRASRNYGSINSLAGI